MVSSLAEAIIYGTDAECLNIINNKAEDFNAIDEYGLTSLIQAIIKKKITILPDWGRAGASPRALRRRC